MTMRTAPIVLLATALITATAQANPLGDPTRPYQRGPVEAFEPVPQGPVLQATRVSALSRSAIISGRTVKIGDSFDGATVVDIAPYEVRMHRAGREIVLRLAPKLAKEKGRAQ